MNRSPQPEPDARLQQLLDEMLAAEPSPPGLDRRIFAATVDRLPRPSAQRPAPDILARIGPWGRLGVAAAAALLLAGTLVSLWSVDQPRPVDGPTVAVEPPAQPSPTQQIDPSPTTVAAAPTPQTAGGAVSLRAVLDQLARAERDADPIDDRIQLLDAQVSWVEVDDFWAEDGLESLDKAIAREDFDQLADDLELYF